MTQVQYMVAAQLGALSELCITEWGECVDDAAELRRVIDEACVLLYCCKVVYVFEPCLSACSAFCAPCFSPRQFPTSPTILQTNPAVTEDFKFFLRSDFCGCLSRVCTPPCEWYTLTHVRMNSNAGVVSCKWWGLQHSAAMTHSESSACHVHWQ